MLKNFFKAFVLTTALPSACGAAPVDYVRPTSSQPWFPYNAYYVNDISGSLHDVVDNTILDLEKRSGESFMHGAPVVDMGIKIIYGDLEDNVIGLATIWTKHCRITMSNKMNPINPSYQGWLSTDFAGVLRHEIGHCFGMDHSDDPNSIMYWQYHPEIHLKEKAIKDFSDDLTNFRESHR